VFERTTHKCTRNTTIKCFNILISKHIHKKNLNFDFTYPKHGTSVQENSIYILVFLLLLASYKLVAYKFSTVKPVLLFCDPYFQEKMLKLPKRSLFQ